MELEVFDAELFVSNDNDDWRSHAETAFECLRWALEEPVAASGLLRAAGHHAALARQMVREDLDDAGPTRVTGAVRMSRPSGGQDCCDMTP